MVNILLNTVLELVFPSLDCENVAGYHMKCMPCLFTNLKFSAFSVLY